MFIVLTNQKQTAEEKGKDKPHLSVDIEAKSDAADEEELTPRVQSSSEIEDKMAEADRLFSEMTFKPAFEAYNVVIYLLSKLDPKFFDETNPEYDADYTTLQQRARKQAGISASQCAKLAKEFSPAKTIEYCRTAEANFANLPQITRETKDVTIAKLECLGLKPMGFTARLKKKNSRAKASEERQTEVKKSEPDTPDLYAGAWLTQRSASDTRKRNWNTLGIDPTPTRSTSLGSVEGFRNSSARFHKKLRLEPKKTVTWDSSVVDNEAKNKATFSFGSKSS